MENVEIAKESGDRRSQFTFLLFLGSCFLIFICNIFSYCVFAFLWMEHGAEVNSIFCFVSLHHFRWYIYFLKRKKCCAEANTVWKTIYLLSSWKSDVNVRIQSKEGMCRCGNDDNIYFFLEGENEEHSSPGNPSRVPKEENEIMWFDLDNFWSRK